MASAAALQYQRDGKAWKSKLMDQFCGLNRCIEDTAGKYWSGGWKWSTPGRRGSQSRGQQ